jgi:hypothetical protein
VFTIMEELRVVLAAATGAVIGIVVVIALGWTLRVLAETAAAKAEPAGAMAGGWMTRLPRLHWTAKLGIVLFSVLAYGFIGYINRSADQAAPPDPQAMQDAAVSPSLPAQFDVGGVQLRFDPPVGYCLYPAPRMQAIVAQQSKLNADNAIHTVFGSCSQLRDAADDQARIHDYGMLMTPRPQLGQQIGRPELDRIVASVGDPTTVKETLDQRLRQAESQLTLQSFSTLGILQRDDGAAYFAYLLKTHTEDGDYNQACVMALTAVKGRLVAYYLYSDYDRDARATLMQLLQRVKASLGDLAALNS